MSEDVISGVNEPGLVKSKYFYIILFKMCHFKPLWISNILTQPSTSLQPKTPPITKGLPTLALSALVSASLCEADNLKSIRL